MSAYKTKPDPDTPHVINVWIDGYFAFSSAPSVVCHYLQREQERLIEEHKYGKAARAAEAQVEVLEHLAELVES